MPPDDRLSAGILMQLIAPQRPPLYPQRWSKHLTRYYLALDRIYGISRHEDYKCQVD
jgi:hypothetical protein